MLDIVIKYAKAGLSLIPCDISTKQPIFISDKYRLSWKRYQTQQPTMKQIETWFTDTPHAVACIFGFGNLELIDIDNHFGDAENIYIDFKELVENTVPGLFEKLYVETTQSGGYHIVYRCQVLEPSLKLAKRWRDETHKDQDALIETRGIGGYALVDPSPGYSAIAGSLLDIKEITPEERSILFSIAKSFHEIEDVSSKPIIKNADAPAHSPAVFEAQELPGAAFNERGDITDTLRSAGWSLLNPGSNKELWCRPGKDRGVSATFNYIKDKFYVFSSSAYPFESGRSYSKFAVESILSYGGDFKSAARELAKKGFGKSFENGNGNGNGKLKGLGAKRKSKTAVSEGGELVDESADNYDEPKEKIKSKKISGSAVIDVIEEYLEDNFLLRYNEVSACTEFIHKNDELRKWDRLEDRNVNEIWRQIWKMNYSFTLDKMEKVIESEFVPIFNPFKEYFDNLPEWDGENHILNYINLIKVSAEQQAIWQKYFLKWIVGVVACATERGLNHNCLVLSGPQGCGKTTIIGKLVPGALKKYYYIAQLNPNDKDSKIAVSESFIINLDELESINRDEIGHLKSLMTIDQVNVRRSYGRRNEVSPRRASFIGSVNKSMFLTDVTGNRRFLTVEVESIDLSRLVDVDQLYAQALSMLNDGYTYWFTGSEIEEVNQNNLKYQVISSEEELLLKHFESPDISQTSDEELKKKLSFDVYKYLTATDIMSAIVKEEPNVRISLTKLGLILKNAGFKQANKKINGKVIRVYLTRKRDKENLFDDEGKSDF